MTIEGERISGFIMLVTIALTLFGLVMVLSASSVASLYQFGASPLYQFNRQVMWAVIGAVTFIIARKIDYRWLQKLAQPATWLAALLLLLVLIPSIGIEVNGSRRWLGIGPARFQPSEIAKLALVLFVADLLARRQTKIDRAELTVRPVFVVLAVFSGLMLMQPKLGTPVVLAMICGSMLFVAGARSRSLLVHAGFLASVAGLAAWQAPYRRARLMAFVDPWQYPRGIGMQTIQSQIGIASGGVLGVGLGGSRAKWGFLPEAQSDFIFAIIAEEVGLIGAISVILIFLIFGMLGAKTAIGAPDPFGKLLAAGLTTWIMIQAFFNIGMTLGLLPITGEPLPFVSVGGSSLVVTLAAAGLLSNIARRAQL